VSARALVVALLLSGVACSAPAVADLWGYIDDQGVAHFAPTQVDPRYKLFFKGRSSLDAPDVAPSKPSPAEILKDNRLFQRVATSPNVKRFEQLIASNAKTNKLDPALVKAMIAVESAFDPAALSPKGAIGLMQIMPATGERYGVADDPKRTAEQKLFEPAINLRVGTRYLRDLLARFDNDLDLVLAAYNAGEGAVEQYRNTVPPFPETQDYVVLVKQFLDFYRPPAPSPAAPRASSRVTIQLPNARR